MPPTNQKPLASLSWNLGVATALAAALVVITFWLAAHTQTENEWVRHTLLVRDKIAALVTLTQRLETSQRGYLLTGREIYLAPFNNAAAAIPAALDDLATQVADNPKQQDSVGQLRKLITDKLREMGSTIDERKAGHTDAALAIVNSDTGFKIMDEIRDLVSAMETEEDRLLAIRRTNAETSAMFLKFGAATAFLLICVIGLLINHFTRRSFAQLAAARDQLSVTNQELLQQVNRAEQVESQLRQSQKMEAIGQLTGGIAHDFNNMLGVIGGSLDLMQRRMKNGDFGIDRYVDAARKAAERAASLTHRLLAFARQQPLAPQTIDANKMIANMSNLLRSTLGEQIRIETVSAAGLWMTHADPHQLESAILNVAINARDAMTEGGKLTIETANVYLDDAYCRQHAEIDPGQFVMIAVSDTGMGMTPEVMQRVFDPFFTTKPVGLGTGLGLSQVYGFVKQSSGHIKIYSEIGAGTTVKIYLPRLVGGALVSDQMHPQAVQKANAGETILVVEDDPLVRRLAIESLHELGYTVLDSEDAAGALAILDNNPEVKLLFTDVVMPEIGGKKLADEAIRRRTHLKVLFTTGYTSNAVVHGGVLDAGVNFLGKPYTFEQLAAKVRTVLDK